jgi:predicted ribosomally synthesized peptide with nif11-like leader
MSEKMAKAVLLRVEDDQAFAAELDALKANPDAVLTKVHAAGFDVTPEEVRAAFLDRYGDQLSPEQLQAVAAGGEGVPDEEAWAIIGAVSGMGIALGAAAGAATMLI